MIWKKAECIITTVTDSDLKELKDLITNGFARVESKITDLDSRISKLEGALQAQQPYIQKIPDMAEKVGELKNWKQIGVTLIGAVIGGFITYLAKIPSP